MGKKSSLYIYPLVVLTAQHCQLVYERQPRTSCLRKGSTERCCMQQRTCVTPASAVGLAGVTHTSWLTGPRQLCNPDTVAAVKQLLESADAARSDLCEAIASMGKAMGNDSDEYRGSWHSSAVGPQICKLCIWCSIYGAGSCHPASLVRLLSWLTISSVRSNHVVCRLSEMINERVL